MKNNFANRLRSLRKSAGLSITALALVASMPRQTIHAYENGTRQPTLEQTRKLCKALDVSLAEFD